MSTVDRGHARERRWGHRLEAEDPARVAFRPRWAIVDVLSMKAGEPTYFDEVKTTRRPYEHFRADARRALSELAAKCGAEARLVHWPLRVPDPKIIPESEWPAT